jgi:hypothetical protein
LRLIDYALLMFGPMWYSFQFLSYIWCFSWDLFKYVASHLAIRSMLYYFMCLSTCRVVASRRYWSRPPSACKPKLIIMTFSLKHGRHNFLIDAEASSTAWGVSRICDYKLILQQCCKISKSFLRPSQISGNFSMHGTIL